MHIGNVYSLYPYQNSESTARIKQKQINNKLSNEYKKNQRTKIIKTQTKILNRGIVLNILLLLILQNRLIACG